MRVCVCPVMFLYAFFLRSYKVKTVSEIFTTCFLHVWNQRSKPMWVLASCGSGSLHSQPQLRQHRWSSVYKHSAQFFLDLFMAEYGRYKSLVTRDMISTNKHLWGVPYLGKSKSLPTGPTAPPRCWNLWPKLTPFHVLRVFSLPARRLGLDGLIKSYQFMVNWFLNGLV